MRNIIKVLIIFLISVLIGNMVYGMYKEMSINDSPSYENYILEAEISNNANNKIKNNLNEQEDKAEYVPKEYKGYMVDAKLSIPAINLNTYVFTNYDVEAMWICPTKYFGPNANEVGNYCIAAHNYNKANMFNNIINLQKGDNIYLTDNTHGKVNYKVIDIYKAYPNDTEALSQQTNGKTCITLITCSDYSSKRIIVKAERVENI